MNSIIQALIIIVLIASLVQSAVLKPRNVDQHPLMLTSNRRSTPLPLWPELSGGNSNIIPTQFLIQLIPSITLSSHQASFLSQFTQQYPDVELLNTFDIGDLQAYAIQLPTDNAALAERALEELRYQPDIERIEYNQLCNATAVQINAPWNLDRISKRNQTLTGNYTFADQAGAGVDVYVLDTGVRVTHVEFEGRARFGASFNGQPGTGDDNGHGTHVAGTVAGKLFGVAKKANIIAVRVLNADGSGCWKVVLAGLDWALKQAAKNSTRPVIVNMSLSGGRSNILNRAVDNLVRAGLAVVVAAGNNAVDACAESPASASFATTVGSTSPMDSLSTFSNFGKCLDIAAPGESILSAWHTGDRDGMYMMGTSMAAPHVAGVQALILSSLNSSGHWKKLTPLKLRSMLVLGATSGVISKVPKSTPNLMLFNNPPMIKI